MSVRTVALLIILVVLPVLGYAAFRWWKVFNSPDGERHRKRRVQGPFVPLSSDEIASDEARKR